MQEAVMEQQQWLVIGISGVTCSGKTTLAQSLYSYLSTRTELKAGIELNRVELINQDSYFRAVDDPNHQKIEQLNHLNWEILESLDMEKMTNDIMSTLGDRFLLYNTRSSALMRSKPHENVFVNHFTSNQSQIRMHSGPEDVLSSNYNKIVKHNVILNVLIIEGFLIFNHTLTFDLCNVKFHLHVPYETCKERRTQRCYDPEDVPCYFEMVVWPAYEKHLREFKDSEEVLFLNGEAAPEKCFQFVLKTLLDEL